MVRESCIINQGGTKPKLSISVDVAPSETSDDGINSSNTSLKSNRDQAATFSCLCRPVTLRTSYRWLWMYVLRKRRIVS